MKHTKDTCQPYHTIIANCCGLGCVNCNACKCDEKPVVKDEIPEKGSYDDAPDWDREAEMERAEWRYEEAMFRNA